MPLKEIQNNHQRLSILHCLAAMDDYTANHQIIQSVCASFGNAMTLDKIKTQLDWLGEQDLVKVDATDNYTIARITQRGLDVEMGLKSVPGVKRPSPKF